MSTYVWQRAAEASNRVREAVFVNLASAAIRRGEKIEGDTLVAMHQCAHSAGIAFLLREIAMHRDASEAAKAREAADHDEIQRLAQPKKAP